MTDLPPLPLDRLPSLRLPPEAPAPVRPGFPWIASAAPIAGAIAIWAITGSTISLAFAALGPLVAVAAMLDGRRAARRERRARSRDRSAALLRLGEEVARRHAQERAEAWRASPSVRDLAARGAPAWRPHPAGRVVVGAGTVPSSVVVEGDVDRVADPEAAEVVLLATRLASAPVSVDLGDGLGVVGPLPLARAVARAMVLRIAEEVHPDWLAVEASSPHWAWTAGLPHHGRGPGGRRLRIVEAGEVGEERREASRIVGRDGETSTLALAREEVGLPPGLRTLIRVRSARSASVEVTGRACVTVEPESVSEAEAAAAAARLRDVASRAGLGSTLGPIPDMVALDDVVGPAALAAGRSTLEAVVGAGAAGPVAIDLVAGPHAIVAGTSGSGKSELLVAWIASMCARYGPDRVAFLLVDFKGGAAFAPVAGLVHVTGVVTDLDEGEAARAVTSLRAELRHRERVLARAGVRAIDELPEDLTLPRLVVVVDEFQAMIERFAELGAVIADLAARGRSLGVHLVLAAQRPNGVVREQVSANCGIRLSLRVLDRADSMAVLGVDAAARLDPARPGRAIVDRGDGAPVEFQAALADDGSIADAARRHPGAGAPRRPWLDRLPSRIAFDDLPAVLGDADAGRDGPTAVAAIAPGPDLVVGVVDEPAAQRRSPATWRPLEDGPLAVLGMPGSGRSVLLEAVSQQVVARSGPGAVLQLDGPRGDTWDRLLDLAGSGPPGEGLDGTSTHVALVVVDDVDERFAGWPDEYRLEAYASLERLLRGVRRGGPAVLLAAGRLAVLPSGIRDAVTSLALLRHPSRADLVHAGGDGALHHPDGPPGAGQWRGHRAQFLHCAPSATRAPRVTDAPLLRLRATGATALATSRPAADARALAVGSGAEVIRLDEGPEAVARAAAVLAGGAVDPCVVVGDADAWAANWAAAAAARSRAEIIVHGGAAEYRALVRDPALPPLLDADRDQCWSRAPGTGTERRTWGFP